MEAVQISTEKAAPERHTEHALYRHFAADGTLLYIGISLNAMARAAQHRQASRWYAESVRMEIQRFPSRRELLLAERAAIRKEKPKHNISLVTMEDEESPVRELNRMEMEHALIRQTISLVYTENNLLHTLCISVAELENLIKQGHIRFFLANGGHSRAFGGKKKRRMFTGWAVLDLLDALEAGTAKLTE